MQLLQRLRLLRRAAGQADDLVVDGAEALDADQQVADAGLLQLHALLALRASAIALVMSVG